MPNKKLILIEDNLGDIELSRRVLSKQPLPIALEVFQNAEEALLTIGGRPEIADLIVLDLNLPGMDGLEFIFELRSLPFPQKIIPIVVLSTSNAGADIAQAYENGANAFLSKPLNYQDFETQFSNCLRFWLHEIKNPINI